MDKWDQYIYGIHYSLFITLGTSTSFIRRAWSFTSNREIKSRAPVNGSVRAMQITMMDG